MKTEIYSSFLRAICGFLGFVVALIVLIESYYTINQETDISLLGVIVMAFGSFTFLYTSIKGSAPFRFMQPYSNDEK